MKRVVLMIIGVAFTLHGYTQTNGNEHKIPKQSSPKNLTNYRLIIDVTFRDLNGNLRSHNITSAKIIQQSYQSTIDQTFQIKDIGLTEINEQGRNIRQLNELEGLNFTILGDNFTNLDFYKDVPSGHIEKIRMVMQDVVGIEVPMMYLDSLELNIPFYPAMFQNQQADFEQSVSFTNQKMRITWLGYSTINGKDCLLIQFGSMYNPFRSEDDRMITNGRSCYWTNVWVSQGTRQIEYAVMHEDIVSITKLKGNEMELKNNIQREVIYEKIE